MRYFVRALEYIISLLLILATHSVFYRMGYWNDSFIKTVIALLVIVLLFVSTRAHLSFKKNMAGWFMLVIGSVAISIILQRRLQYAHLISYFILPLAFLLLLGSKSRTIMLRQMLSAFVNCMAVIALFSLFFWILGDVIGLIPYTSAVQFEWAGTREAHNYFNLYFTNLWQRIEFLGYNGYRNCGIFAEAPMYSYLLCLALAFNELYISGEKSISIIFSVVIFSTMSTTGILAVIFLFSAKYFFSFGRKQIGFYANLRLIILPILIIGGLVGLIYFWQLKMMQGGDSVSVRLAHALACFRSFFVTFPSGSGFSDREIINQFMSILIGRVQGIATGLLYYLAQSGLSGLLMAVYPMIWYLVKSVRRRNWHCFVFGMLFLYLIFTTNIMSTPTVWFTLFYVMIATNHGAHSRKRLKQSWLMMGDEK